METQMADTQEVFDRVFDAAKLAASELEKLCGKFDVPYLDYSRVYDAIMGICGEVR